MSDAGYTVRALTPITDPRELRDATVRDYVRAVERSGQPVDLDAIYKLAIRHLEIVDAYNRGDDLTRPKKRPAPKYRRLIANAEHPARSAPVATVPASGQRDRNILHANPFQVSARWPYAMGRIRRIVAGARAASTLAGGTSTAECPDLALRFLRLYAAYMTRHRESRHNPFRGLTERDAARAFVRGVEDICDASSSKLGSWWVPK